MPDDDRATGGSSNGGAPGTAGAAYQWLRQALRAADIDSADLDARRLLSAATGVTLERMVASPDTALDEDQRSQLAAVMRRRLAHEPVSRIVGERGFFGLTFKVTPSTLDPRPETETIVEVALAKARALDSRSKRPLRMLDVGTGSGTIAIAVLVTREADPATRGRTQMVATDIDPRALAVAAFNARRLGVDQLISFRVADRLLGIAGPFDLMASNPPYIPHHAIANLAPDVRNYDPLLALDGGTDGLDFYRDLIGEARRIVPAGEIVLEIGQSQQAAIAALVETTLPASVSATLRFAPDMAGVPRCAAFSTQNLSLPK